MTVTDWIVCLDACGKFNLVDEAKKVRRIITALVDANLESAEALTCSKGQQAEPTE